MKKPVITQEVRFPTDVWSGMGFSKSMPESAIREQLVIKKLLPMDIGFDVFILLAPSWKDNEGAWHGYSI